MAAPLTPVLVPALSVTTNDDIKMIPGTVHRSSEFILRLWKSSSRRLSDQGPATIHRLKWGPLSPNDVGRIAQHVGKGEGAKDGVRGSSCKP